MQDLLTPRSSVASRKARVALVGNPNTGKSALFNRLTGARQRVGNYPGLTIERKSGSMRLGDREVDVIDLPGLYSLAALSPDEQIVLDVLEGTAEVEPRPDLVVCVVDASNLTRNLFLVSQIAEVGLPMVVVLNMWDAAESGRKKIDYETLSARLGVPVVPTVASKGRGVEELKQVINEALADRPAMVQVDWPRPVQDAVSCLRRHLGETGEQEMPDVDLRRLLFDIEGASTDRLLRQPERSRPRVTLAREHIEKGGWNPSQVESLVRYGWLDTLLTGVYDGPRVTRRSFGESVDDLLTHRVFGLIIFTAIMYVVFQSIYTFATPFMDLIEGVFSAVGSLASGWLAATPMLQSLVVNGVIAGVGGVLVFLPQIVILFLFITLLEDSGYMPRAAFLMDRLLGWCGLSGKSFVPMLSSFACAVPGVMAARTIQDPKARLTTILVCPLMSCSARLPVYVLLIGAFIEPVTGPMWAGLTLFAMHFVGLAISVPVAFIFNRIVLKGRRTPFVLEMPPYRVPQVRDIAYRVWSRGKEFVVRAGTVIFAMSIVIWALSYFPRSEEVAQSVRTDQVQQLADERGVTPDQAASLFETDPALAAHLKSAIEARFLERSYLGRLGHTVQPLFAPAGFDWRITVGVLAAFPAREVIISTLGILYNLGADVSEEDSNLVAAMQKATRSDGTLVFSPLVAIALMVFFALCSQCMATLATIARESSWKWAAFTFVYMTVLAWVGAVAVFQIGSAIL
ncbi:MAG: ferrous iron transport protein B [Rhodothermales bacterium]